MKRHRVLRRGLAACGTAGALLLSSCSNPAGPLDFTASAVTGSAPLVVMFACVFQGDAQAYAWSFGDGGTSSERSPMHTYVAAGAFSVTLTVTADQGRQVTVTKRDLIHVTAGQDSPLLFWSERGSGKISRSTRTGADRATIVAGLISPEDLVVASGRVYWTDYGAGRVESANLDGTGRQVIASDQHSPTGIAVDRVRARLYWTCLPSGLSDSTVFTGSIKRANFDGSGVETLAAFSPSDSFAWQIVVDSVAGKLFWISLDWTSLDAGTCGGRILRAGLDAQGPVAVVSGLCDPTDLTLDGSTAASSTYVYWTIEDPGTIWRARVGGTDAVSLVTGVPNAESVVVDPSEERVYWTAGSSLQRANLDGSGVTTLFSDLVLPEGIAIDR